MFITCFFNLEILLTYINLYVNIYFKVDRVNNTVILVWSTIVILKEKGG